MASYTDRTPQFNPYVEQLPVDAMIKVGMEKQQRYDQGIQKIQGQIDNVAGLDIAKESHKQYLQSKLNELGNNLKTVAAADFSNSQITNSTAGMAASIAKDPIIQGAVYSTQIVRKGQNDLETAKQQGKWSVNNEKNWNKQVGRWLNDGDLQTRFNGEYVPYTDLTEKYNKVTKDTESVENSYDMPYITDAAGKPMYFTRDKTGKLVETPQEKGGQLEVDDAMKRISVKGKPAQTLLNNFYNNTTANDQRQLAIDAEAKFDGATPEMLAATIVSTTNLQKKQLNEHVTDLGVKLKDPRISDKEKATLQAEYSIVNDKLKSGDLDKEMAAQLEQLKNPASLEAYKTKLYTQQYLTNLAQDSSTRSYKEELISNPYAQMGMEKKKFQFDIQKENNVMARFNADHKQSLLIWKANYDQKERFNLAKLKAKEGGEPVIEPGGVRTDVEKPTSNTISDRITATTTARQMQDAEFLSNNSGYTKQQLDVLAANHDKDPDSVNTKNPDLMKYLDQRLLYEHQMMRDGTLLKSVSKQTKEIDQQIGDVFRNEIGIVDRNGREVYSAQELYTLGRDLDAFKRTIPGVGIPYGPYDEASALKKYAGTKYESLARAYIDHNNGKRLTQEQKIILDRAGSLANHYGGSIDKLIDQKLTIESDYLATKMPKYQTMEGTLDVNNKHDISMAHQLISNAIGSNLPGLDTEHGEGFDIPTLTQWQEDPKIKQNLTYRIVKNYDGSGKFIVQHGKDRQTIPMTAERFKDYFPRYSEVNPVTQIKDIILQSPEKTTNPLKKGDPVNAAFRGTNLPLLQGTNYASKVRYDIEASSTKGPITDYMIRLYVWDGRIWHDALITQNKFVSDVDLQDKINGIGMEMVNYVLKQ